MRTTPKKFARLGVIGFTRWKELGIKTSDHYSNKVMCAWNVILHNPPPSSRQIKLTKKSNGLPKINQKPMKEVRKQIKQKIINDEKQKSDYHYYGLFKFEQLTLEKSITRIPKKKCYKQEDLSEILLLAEKNLRKEVKNKDYQYEENLLTQITNNANNKLPFTEIQKLIHALDCEHCEFRRMYRKSTVTEPCKTCYSLFELTGRKTEKWKEDKKKYY